jgi:uncharacterized protein YaiI (UPF0178 family)
VLRGVRDLLRLEPHIEQIAVDRAREGLLEQGKIGLPVLLGHEAEGLAEGREDLAAVAHVAAADGGDVGAVGSQAAPQLADFFVVHGNSCGCIVFGTARLYHKNHAKGKKRRPVMTIYVDADACPVTCRRRPPARARNFTACPLVLLCDTNHVLESDYGDRSDGDRRGARRGGSRAREPVQAPGDVVVTQDYGLAALAHGEGRVSHPPERDALHARQHRRASQRALSRGQGPPGLGQGAPERAAQAARQGGRRALSPPRCAALLRERIAAARV